MFKRTDRQQLECEKSPQCTQATYFMESNAADNNGLSGQDMLLLLLLFFFSFFLLQYGLKAQAEAGPSS